MATGSDMSYNLHTSDGDKEKDSVVIFATSEYSSGQYPSLKWVAKDFEELNKYWEGYNIIPCHDYTVAKMSDQINQVCKNARTDCSCLVMIFLGYGDHGLIRARDGNIALQKLVEPLKECENLAGKPKIFILQTEVKRRMADSVPEWQADSDTPVRTVIIPTEADWIYLWCRIPGAKCVPDPKASGSLFMQMLLENLRIYARQPISRVMRRTIKSVHQRLEAVDPAFLTKNQELPFVINQLRKQLIIPITPLNS